MLVRNNKNARSLVFWTLLGIKWIYLPSSNKYLLNNVRPFPSYLSAAWQFPNVSSDWSISCVQLVFLKARTEIAKWHNRHIWIKSRFYNCCLMLLANTPPFTQVKHTQAHSKRKHTRRHKSKSILYLYNAVLRKGK